MANEIRVSLGSSRLEEDGDGVSIGMEESVMAYEEEGRWA